MWRSSCQDRVCTPSKEGLLFVTCPLENAARGDLTCGSHSAHQGTDLHVPSACFTWQLKIVLSNVFSI